MPCVDMPWANPEASLVEGLMVPFAQRRGWFEGVIIALIPLLLSRSSSGCTRNVMYHFRESDAVLHIQEEVASETLGCVFRKVASETQCKAICVQLTLPRNCLCTCKACIQAG